MRRPAAAALALAALGLLDAAAARPAEPDWDARRQAMVREITSEVRATSRYLGFGRLHPRVTAAMASVPRHRFVPEDLRRHAYENRPLPIGHGQTISQPYIVALMTQLLGVEPGDKVLEVGTGSGYQAAVLAELGVEVYTLEIIPALAREGAAHLAAAGYDGVEVENRDGYYGWPEHAPFDGIVVTAAASHIPSPLVEQLAPGARMVIPVGGRFMTQQLTLVEKTAQGKIRTRQLLPVVFVPLTGEH